MSTSLKKGLFVAASVLIVLLIIASAIRSSLVFATYAEIAKWLSISLNLDNIFVTIISVILTSVLYCVAPYFIWNFVFGTHKKEVVISTIGLSIIISALLYLFGRDVYFNPITGDPIQYYAATPAGILFSREQKHDATWNVEYKPITKEIMESIYNAQKGIVPEMVTLESLVSKKNGFKDVKFFDTTTGRPNYYFYRNENGSIDLFSGAGFHQTYNEPLKPVTPEIVKSVLKNLSY